MVNIFPFLNLGFFRWWNLRGKKKLLMLQTRKLYFSNLGVILSYYFVDKDVAWLHFDDQYGLLARHVVASVNINVLYSTYRVSP